MSEEGQSVAEIEPPVKSSGLLRNYISFVGAAIVAASLASTILLFLLEITSGTDNPYLGIFTYIVFPGFLIFGLLVAFLGALLERRRRRTTAPSEIPAYPVLDLNDPRRRRTFFVFLGITFLFIFMTAFGSYRAYEYTESVAFCGTACHTVMKPEFIAFQASPHARLRCVDCHVGSGTEWYLRSKLTGVHQLYAVTFNRYQKPIEAPIQNMRPARDTCEQCHWAQRFYGNELKVFNHYAADEANTLRQTRMLINVGGGSPATGPVEGIHWHMNLANEISFLATDLHRQIIPWIRIKDKQGNLTEYVARDRQQLTPDEIAKAPQRRMDCIDCHNRPAHVYVNPEVAVDDSFTAGKLDSSLPYLKRQSIEVLSQNYATTGEALKAIALGLDGFYRANYPDIYSQKGDSIKGAVAEVERIYQTYFFPEMKTDWQTHPDNIGHLYSSGCFRCHDGEHVSSTGKVVTNDCNICHTMLEQNAIVQPSAPQARGLQVRHPIDLGDLASTNCTSCHKGNAEFKHPVDLGDISEFQCIECHKGKLMKLAS